MAKTKIGKIPVYKGEYDNNTIYNRLNQVTYLGTTFLSIVDNNLGHPPAEKSEDGGEISYINTNYWDIIAKGIDNIEERTATNNSMGYKILKKNKSFAEQVTKENTIYEIRYNFTLTEDVTIPANCVLEFNGGSISASGSNNTITGNNTFIKSCSKNSIFSNVVLNGFKGLQYYFFDSTYSDSDIVDYCINSNEVVDFNNKEFLFDREVDVLNPVKVYNATFKSNGTYNRVLIEAMHNTALTPSRNINYIHFENIIFDGNNVAFKGLNILYIPEYVNVINCKFINFNYTLSNNEQQNVIGLYVHGCYNTYITGCYFNEINAPSNETVADSVGCARAIMIESARDSSTTLIQGCRFIKINAPDDGDFIHLHEINFEDSTIKPTSIKIIENCYFGEVNRRSIKSQARNVVIRNNVFKSINTVASGNSPIGIFGSYQIIEGNYIECTASHYSCIFFSESYLIHDIKIINNVFVKNGGRNTSVIHSQCPIYNFICKNNRFTNIATALNNYTHCFRFDNSLYDSIISDNLIDIGNGSAGCIFYINSYSSQVTSEIIYKNIVIKHNTTIGRYAFISLNYNTDSATINNIVLSCNIFITHAFNDTKRAFMLSLNDVTDYLFAHTEVYDKVSDIDNKVSDINDNIGYMINCNKHKGSTAERPVAISWTGGLHGDLRIGNIGYEYFDTTLNKPLYVKAISEDTVTWVDATGLTV